MAAHDTDVARIRAIDDGWKRAAAARDLDGMMSIYAPDAQELLPDLPPVVGRAAIRAFYEQMLEQLPRCAHDFRIQNVVVSEAADIAVTQGEYRFVPDSQRPQDARTGKFAAVWRRRDGDWRLQMNITCADTHAALPQDLPDD
jgi:uncharacterized protein (TIGR02246 family)